jgi:hypothetical protein
MKQLTMMTGARYDEHFPLHIALLTHVLDGFVAALRVHPVVLAVFTLKLDNETTTTSKLLTDERHGDLQCGNTIHHRFACVGTRSEKMC